MSIQSPITVSVTRRFQAPAERVFDAWLDAPSAAKWIFATPDGEMVRAEVDPRVGGKWLFTERRNGEDIDHTGEYLEVDCPNRLKFTFLVPKYSTDAAIVEIDIVALETGCELTLTQQMAPEYAEWADPTKQGWTSILGGLAKSLGE